MVNSPHFRGYTRLGGELTGGAVDWREQIDVGPERDAADRPGRALPAAAGPQPVAGRAAGAARGSSREWDRRARRRSAKAVAALGRIARQPGGRVRRGVRGHPGDADQDRALSRPRPTARRASARTATPACSRCCWPNRAAGAARSRGRRRTAWIDVDPLPGAFIVNIGEMLEIASGGYLRATEHRVGLSTRERISVPYFFNPRLDAQIPVLTLPDELAAARPRRHRRPVERADLLGLRPQRLEEPAAGAPGRGRGPPLRVKMESAMSEHRSEPDVAARGVRALPDRRHRDRRGGRRRPGGPGRQHLRPGVARSAAGVVLRAEHVDDVAEAEGSAVPRASACSASRTTRPRRRWPPRPVTGSRVWRRRRPSAARCSSTAPACGWRAPSSRRSWRAITPSWCCGCTTSRCTTTVAPIVSTAARSAASALVGSRGAR